jgi:hypothetical protein
MGKQMVAPAAGEPMRFSMLRIILSCLLVVVLPASMFAADSSAAMLYTNGTAWINGAYVPKSSAVFSGDLVQTRSDSVANIKSLGSSLLVLPDSLVEFQGSLVKLEHGRLSITTSKSMGTQVGGLKIVPVSSAWTEFEVSDTDGTVKIVARKGDLTLIDAKGTSTLAQGQEASRDESSHKKDKGGAGAAPAAGGGVLDSPVAVGIGAGVAGALGVWAIALNGDDPASPAKPK